MGETMHCPRGLHVGKESLQSGGREALSERSRGRLRTTAWRAGV